MERLERLQINPRVVITAIVAFLGFWLLRRGTDFELSAGEQGAALVAGLVLFGAAVVVLFRDYHGTAPESDDGVIQEPRISRFLFSSPMSAPLWLGARLYLGYEWFDAGRHKFSQDAWMKTGDALKGYWMGAVKVPEGGAPKASYDIYREYLQYMINHEWYTWFAKIIVFGEILVGLGLIFGALTGFAAFFGALMNMSFMLAGSVSTNPILFITSIFIILAWRVAGWIGVDRVLLPSLGAPWKPGRLVNHGTPQTGAAAAD